MKSIYFECYAGISGDMTVGALLDLGADKEKLLHILKDMNLECDIAVGRRNKCGISACDFDVRLHEHHEHDGDHHHDHRGLSEITALIDGSPLSERAKGIAKRIFRIIAEAEGKVHGLPPEEVHFHEVGAADSLADICAAAFCIDDLNIGKVYSTPLYEGRGYVECQHGRMPVPAPATAEIAAKSGIPLMITENQGEMVTPTGAAILAGLNAEFFTPALNAVKIGMGAGKKDFPHANILRSYLLCEPESGVGYSDTVTVLESVIDDSTPEQLSYAMEKILAAGARDVFFTPVYMKKNRPAFQLTVLCDEEAEARIVPLIFAHTSAIGLRRQRIQRIIMNRTKSFVPTKYGDIAVKRCNYEDIEKCYPEYESLRAAAEKHGCSLSDVIKAL